MTMPFKCLKVALPFVFALVWLLVLVCHEWVFLWWESRDCLCLLCLRLTPAALWRVQIMGAAVHLGIREVNRETQPFDENYCGLVASPLVWPAGEWCQQVDLVQWFPARLQCLEGIGVSAALVEVGGEA